MRHLAEILDAVEKVRLDELVEVLALLRLLHLSGDLERQSGLHRDGDGTMRALVRAEAAEKEEVVATVWLAGIDGEVERVMAVGDPVQVWLRLPLVHRDRDQAEARRELRNHLVDLPRLALERTVHRMDERCRRRRAERRAEHPGVVVDDVELLGARKARECMLQLPERAADLTARRLGEDGRELRL